MTKKEIKQANDGRKKEYAAMQEVDRQIQNIINSLENTGRLANTYIIYTSDQGYLFGEHRLGGKNCMYDECIHIPFYVRGPNMVPHLDSNLISNVDLAPTIIELAGIAKPSGLNGLSFVPLLTNSSDSWRDSVFVEVLGESPKEAHAHAVRTKQYLYAEYKNGDKEFYDLAIDPYQLESKHNDPAYASIITGLKAKLEEYKTQ